MERMKGGVRIVWTMGSEVITTWTGRRRFKNLEVGIWYGTRDADEGQGPVSIRSPCMMIAGRWYEHMDWLVHMMVMYLHVI